MWIIKNQKIFLSMAGLLIASSIAALLIWGLKIGIDFKGGSLTEVTYVGESPTMDEIKAQVAGLDFGEALIQPVGEGNISIKSKDLTENERQTLITSLAFDGKYKVEEKAFTSIGPSVGSELKRRSIVSLVIVELAMILFIAYAFRKVSKPVSSWRFGIATVLALSHDIIVTTGAFVLISHLTGAEASTLFVVALLTIQGLSVNDTIVVFDRIRENLTNKISPDFKVVVGKSIDQTILRSVNTSISVIIVLLALFFVGPESTKIFSLTLACGMFFGTYSSIFIASPLLVMFEEWQEKRRKN